MPDIFKVTISIYLKFNTVYDIVNQNETSKLNILILYLNIFLVKVLEI
jgi:hypothetical protein